MSASPLHAIVFGPFKSPRFGPTLGIHPAPTRRKDCPPDCAYCKYGLADTVPILTRARQRPTPGVVVTSAARKLIEFSKAGDKVATILVTGIDDPTKHRHLLEISENLRTLRNKWFAKAKLTLATRGEGLQSAETRRALMIYDQPIVRIEWGTAKTFAAMTGRPSTALNRMCERLRPIDKLIIEATFVRGKFDNSTDAEVKNWIKRVADLSPKEVHIGTLPASTKRTADRRPITPTRLDQIAAKVTDETGIPVTLLDLEAALV